MKPVSLNIAMLGTRGIPNAYGGFEQCVQFLSKGLVELGHNVTVYCSSLHPEPVDDYHSVALVHIKDPSDVLGTMGQFVYDFRCIQHAKRQHFDIIIQFGYTSSSLWQAWWPKEVKHLVNMDGIEYLRSKYTTLVQSFLQYAEKLAVRGADTLIADNSGVASYLTNKYPHSRIRQIAYGAEIPTTFATEADLKSLGLTPKSFDLIICRLEPENNLSMMLEAHIKADCPRPLIIVGGKHTRFYRKLKKRFRHSSIRFIGGVYDKSLLDALRKHCNLYLHGHSVGGTNPSLLEAMATADIIAVHDNVFNRSVIGNHAHYFKDAVELSDFLAKTFAPSEFSEWSEVNRKRISETYNWNTIIKAYESACYELV